MIQVVAVFGLVQPSLGGLRKSQVTYFTVNENEASDVPFEIEKGLKNAESKIMNEIIEKDRNYPGFDESEHRWSYDPIILSVSTMKL